MISAARSRRSSARRVVARAAATTAVDGPLDQQFLVAEHELQRRGSGGVDILAHRRGPAHVAGRDAASEIAGDARMEAVDRVP